MKAIVQTHQDLDLYVRAAAFCYNNTIHSSHNLCPSEVLFGKRSMLPHTLKYIPKSDTAPSVETHVERIRRCIDLAQSFAQNQIELSQKTYKR